jgi:hypothetical protein
VSGITPEDKHDILSTDATCHLSPMAVRTVWKHTLRREEFPNSVPRILVDTLFNQYRIIFYLQPSDSTTNSKYLSRQSISHLTSGSFSRNSDLYSLKEVKISWEAGEAESYE